MSLTIREDPNSVNVNEGLTFTLFRPNVVHMANHTGQNEVSLTELAAVVDGTSAVPALQDESTLISRADELVRRSQARLVELVVSARAAGVPWQAIGDALGVSRQAAFKRFGGAVAHPSTEMDITKQTVDLMDRTRAVFERLDAGDYEAVRSQMTYACARTLSERRIQGVWNEVATQTGRLESATDLTLQTPDGTNALNKLANGLLLADGAIVQATLRHEAGEWIGRVAFNAYGKITGLLILPPDARDLPF